MLLVLGVLPLQICDMSIHQHQEHQPPIQNRLPASDTYCTINSSWLKATGILGLDQWPYLVPLLLRLSRVGLPVFRRVESLCAPWQSYYGNAFHSITSRKAELPHPEIVHVFSYPVVLVAFWPLYEAIGIAEVRTLEVCF